MENHIEIRPGRTINLVTYPHPTSKETAFLVHGLGGRGEQWREQIPLLKDKYSLIIPDLLGHGKSDKPPSQNPNPYGFIEYTKDLEVIFKQYASSQNIILGHSYGGALAASLAFDHQNNVNKLILLSPLACTAMMKTPLVYYLPNGMLELLLPLLEKQFMRLAFDISANPNLVAEEAKAFRANPMHVIKSMIHGMKEIPTLDVAKLNTSTLMILGEHDDVIPPNVSKQFYNVLPHHQFEMIVHAAHMTMLEKPEQVNAYISNWLSQ